MCLFFNVQIAFTLSVCLRFHCSAIASANVRNVLSVSWYYINRCINLMNTQKRSTFQTTQWKNNKRKQYYYNRRKKLQQYIFTDNNSNIFKASSFIIEDEIMDAQSSLLFDNLHRILNVIQKSMILIYWN